jgi:hypothetical protein
MIITARGCTIAHDGGGAAAGESPRIGEEAMPPETLPLLLATLAAYVMLGAGTLFRVRRRRRAEPGARAARARPA